MAGDSPSRLEHFLHSPKAIVGMAVMAVGALVSVYAFIDGGNDELKSVMIEHFETLAQSDATSRDDLNYRLGIHRGIEIGKLICGTGGSVNAGELARLMQEGT